MAYQSVIHATDQHFTVEADVLAPQPDAQQILAPRFTATESLHRSGSNNFQLAEETSFSCHRSGKISHTDRRQLQSPEPLNSLTTEASSHPLIFMWLSKPAVFWPRIPDIFSWRRPQDDMAMWELRVGNCDDSAYRL